MKYLVIILGFLAWSDLVWSRAAVPETTIDHAWVKGVYWNPTNLPGWGFFVDVQEETMFGAIYGYMGSDATFITFQGNVTTALPLTFRGDVYFVTDGGSTATDVGNFTWIVEDYEASPSANLTITSNILNRTNLRLVRFSYAEIDKVDIFTAADWNIVRRVLGTSFADQYSITDDRETVDGFDFALVVDNSDMEKVGAIGYYSDPSGYAYAMLVQFTDSSNVFYMFVANDIEMYGRYWLLDEGEDPSGNGSYFRGSIATMQASHQTILGGQQIVSRESLYSTSREIDPSLESRRLEALTHEQSKPQLEALFSEELVQGVYHHTRQYFLTKVGSKN